MTAPLTPRKKIVAVVVYCFFAMSGMAMIAVSIRVFVWTLGRMPTGGIVLVGAMLLVLGSWVVWEVIDDLNETRARIAAATTREGE